MIQGWFDFSEFYDVIAERIPNNCTVCEVGVWKGASFVYLMYALQKQNKTAHGIAVDAWDETKFMGPQLEGKTGDEILAEFQRNSVHLNNIDILRMTSEEASKHIPDKSLAFCFIDAGHEYEDISRDIRVWKDKVIPGCVLAGHDIHYEPVLRATQEAFGDALQQYGSCWLVNIPKEI